MGAERVPEAEGMSGTGWSCRLTEWGQLKRHLVMEEQVVNALTCTAPRLSSLLTVSTPLHLRAEELAE